MKITIVVEKSHDYHKQQQQQQPIHRLTIGMGKPEDSTRETYSVNVLSSIEPGLRTTTLEIIHKYKDNWFEFAWQWNPSYKYAGLLGVPGNQIPLRTDYKYIIFNQTL